MLLRIVSSRWFRLADLFLVILGGLLWMSMPEIGVLPVLALALFPPVLRILSGLAPFKKTPLDWLVTVFLLTGWVGYWAAYHQEAAWTKVWFIVLSVLLYYALAAQPKENLDWVCVILFSIGFGVAVYFFLTQDFVALPRKVEFANRVGRWIMGAIPRVSWEPIHPNYVAGITAILTPFVLYPTHKLLKKGTAFSVTIVVAASVGVAVALLAILMATSRGVMMAIAGAIGGWIIWRIISFNGSRLRFRHEALFPFLILFFLFAMVVFLYLGPANAGSLFSGNSNYGTGSRGELAGRSLYLLLDFPITGGGLASFPGLYSRYILGIPSFYLLNSHNLFLDVAIEQGVLGGFSVLLIFLMSIWLMSREVANVDSQRTQTFAWLTFSALLIAFVHGMVDDYLYNGPGTFLLLAFAGLSMIEQPGMFQVSGYNNKRALRIVALVATGFILINLNHVRAAWDANLGAVRMSKVELAGFPTNQWANPSILTSLEPASAALHSALQADPENQTANYHLGLIALLKQDFPSAATYLERVHQELPDHRGMIKALGYSHAWLGEMEAASSLLSTIPEARDELDAYVWWWGTQGRDDLAERAFEIFSIIERQLSQK